MIFQIEEVSLYIHFPKNNIKETIIMKNTILLLNSLWLFGLVACQPKPVASLSECPVVNIRSALQEEAPISMKEDVESIEYVPLETTDSCLISNLMNLQVTADYMFMYNGKTEEVLQFNREGKFIRKIGCQGNGPGEYGMISDLAVDDRNKELSLFQYGGDAWFIRMTELFYEMIQL